MEETKKRGRRRKSDTTETIKFVDAIDVTDAIVAVMDDSHIEQDTNETQSVETVETVEAAPIISEDIQNSSENIIDTDTPTERDSSDTQDVISNGKIMNLDFAKMYTSSAAVDPFYVIRGQIVVVDGTVYDGRIKVMCLYGRNAVGWVNISDVK